MEQIQKLQAMLGEITKPAFLVENDIVVAYNSYARPYAISEGMHIQDIIPADYEAYSTFQGERMFLTVSIGRAKFRGAVTALGEYRLFTMDTMSDSPELQALALAAMKLTRPLSALSNSLHHLEGIPDELNGDIQQSYLQIRRIVDNMADAVDLESASSGLMSCDLGALFRETLEKAQTYLSYAGVTLNCDIMPFSAFGLANERLLRRAIYNMLANAVKFTDEGGTICISLSKHEDRILFTVTDGGSQSGLSPAGMFNRYTRQPGLEDPRHGIGLGMSFIHAAASTHGGTVFVQQTADRRTQVTMTLQIRRDSKTVLRTPVLIPDIYGGYDPALIELSEVLPSGLYKNECPFL